MKAEVTVIIHIPEIEALERMITKLRRSPHQTSSREGVYLRLSYADELDTRENYAAEIKDIRLV
jgi:hypothetical protein